MSDVISVVADFGAFVVAAVALTWSVLAARGSKARTEAAEGQAKRSAEAAEQSAVAAASSAAEARRSNDIAERQERRQLQAANARSVTWTITHSQGFSYLLRNTGNALQLLAPYSANSIRSDNMWIWTKTRRRWLRH